VLLLDQGSHACKAVLAETGGRTLAECSVAVDTLHDPARPERVEHSAQALVAAMRQAVDTVCTTNSGAPPARVEAAARATQRSTIACWHRSSGEALSPVISWQDRRAAEQLQRLDLDPAEVRRITGLLPTAHYGASKLRWCLDELPAVRAAATQGQLCMGPVASFLLHRLLAEQPCMTDPANASRTLLWDVEAHDWSDTLLTKFGIPRDCLPRSVPSRHPYGTLPTPAGPVPLAVCTGDQAAALFAEGEPAPDTLYVNIGTGAFLQRRCAGTPPEAAGLLQSVAWQDATRSLQVLEGTVNGAGSALSWLAEEAGVTEAALIALLDTALDEARSPPLFVNGVGGLGSPFWEPRCPVRFEGEGDLAARGVAVIESIVFLLQVNIEAMSRVADPPRRLRVSGGLARLDGLCRRLANLSGLPVLRPADFESTLSGLAWLLGGRTLASPAGETLFQPQSDEAFATRYQRWRGLLTRHGIAAAVPPLQ
jgi:glycerol kinase